jgi:uncharacterized protein YegL
MKTTHVALILDKSGSMSHIAEEAVNYYNDQVRTFKKTAAEEGADIKVSLITFSSDVYEHLWAVPAADLQECKQGDYVADGWTAMLDAIGYTVEKFRETTDYNNPDNVYLVMIISDGQENYSKHFNESAVNEMIDSLQKTNRWTFTFMGCNREYIQQTAQRLNVPIANCAAWDNHDKCHAHFGYAASNVRTEHMVRGLASRKAKSYVTGYSDNDVMMASFDALPVDSDIGSDNMCVSPEFGTTAIFSTGSKVTSWKQDLDGPAVSRNFNMTK